MFRPVEDGREIVEIKDFTFNIMDRMVKMVYTGSLDTIKECINNFVSNFMTFLLFFFYSVY